jgi:hypothetical protein
MRPRLTYANVMATIAVFIALGGASYAALKVPKNTVGAQQLKKNAVTTAKIKKEAVTAAKVKKGTLTGAQINASTLGTVPSAHTSEVAQTANAVAPSEPWHVVGAGGEPPFLGSWSDVPASNLPSVSFYKDREGIVHMIGYAAHKSEELDIFQLPPGFRPPTDKDLGFQVGCIGVLACSDRTGEVLIIGSEPEGAYGGVVEAPVGATEVRLDGIAFRAES